MFLWIEYYYEAISKALCGRRNPRHRTLWIQPLITRHKTEKMGIKYIVKLPSKYASEIQQPKMTTGPWQRTRLKIMLEATCSQAHCRRAELICPRRVSGAQLAVVVSPKAPEAAAAGHSTRVFPARGKADDFDACVRVHVPGNIKA